MRSALVHAMMGAVLLVPCAGVHADDLPSGFYGGVSVGPSQFSGCGEYWGTTCASTDRAFRLFLGYEINNHLAVEAGIANLGGITGSNQSGGFRSTTTASAAALDVVGVVSVPLRERLSLYGKLGLYMGNVQSQTDGFDFGSADLYAGGVTFGLGARYDFTDHIAARLEWQRYNDLYDANIDVMSVGVVFRF